MTSTPIQTDQHTTEQTTAFADGNGKTWSAEVSVETIRRVKELLSVDLMKIYAGDHKIIAGLLADPFLLCDTLYAVVKPQADAARIDSKAFGELLKGDVLGHATDALVEGILRFPRHPEARAALRSLFKAQMDLETRGLSMVRVKVSGESLEKISRAAMARLEEEIDRNLAPLLSSSGERSTSTPQSSASTPDPSPSGS